MLTEAVIILLLDLLLAGCALGFLTAAYRVRGKHIQDLQEHVRLLQEQVEELRRADVVVRVVQLTAGPAVEVGPFGPRITGIRLDDVQANVLTLEPGADPVAITCHPAAKLYALQVLRTDQAEAEPDEISDYDRSGDSEQALSPV